MTAGDIVAKSFRYGVVCPPLVTEELLTTLGAVRLPTLCTELMDSRGLGVSLTKVRTSSQSLA